LTRSAAVGQPFIIDNRGGGGALPRGGGKPIPTAMRCSPTAALTIFPAAHRRFPYDTERDFTGVVALVSTPFLLVVSPQKCKTAQAPSPPPGEPAR
jgi:tripartite-type tricarboxylate transporter receptor subunit TctC